MPEVTCQASRVIFETMLYWPYEATPDLAPRVHPPVRGAARTAERAPLQPPDRPPV